MSPHREIKLMAEASESNRLETQAKLDRVTAERDAALARLEEALVESLSNQNEREVVCANYEVLQQRLTAADERNDNRDSEIFAQVQSALRRSFSLGQIYWQQADSDSTCQQNKSDQTMGVQEQHILNVLKSLGAALKPAEGGGDRPAAVKPFKLPERKSAVDTFSTYGLGECAGWNKCLDALGDAFGGE